MNIPTEAIGSIPRPPELLEAIQSYRAGDLGHDTLNQVYDNALRDTIRRLEKTGSPIISDGEQTKSSFATYPLSGLENIADDGIVIPFEDGHTRQLPKLAAGPFRYAIHAVTYLNAAKRYTQRPLKQAVISATAVSLIYPQEGITGYEREAFLNDLVWENVADIRGCLDADAHHVQIDFTEGRLSVKLDPTKQLLQDFIDLNNRVLEQFSHQERQRIGVHTCPGGDYDSAHSADVDYAELLPALFTLKAGHFYMQLASEKDPERVLAVVRDHLPVGRRIYIGVIDVLDPRVETPEQVRDRVLRAAEYIPLNQLGTTDDCGFSPFEDDTSTGRDTAFAKIEARVRGTQMAAEALSR